MGTPEGLEHSPSIEKEDQSLIVLPFVAEILGPDILIILAIVALLFGSTRLPKLARSLGSARSEFEKGLAEGAGTGADAGDRPKPAEETVTLTRAELDAMIVEREARGRATAPHPAELPPVT